MSKLPHIRTLWKALRTTRHDEPRERDLSADELPPIDESVTDTGYYNEISFRYHSIQIVCIMLLAVFFAVTLMTDARALSADNLIYFAKDLATTVADKEIEAKDTFVYAADENNVHTLYRDGLVVLGKQKLTVFTATGREAYAELLSYQNPRLVASGRYLVAYDMGGKSVRLYNSFTCVKEIAPDHPVRTVAVCNEGYYCVVTDGTEYASEVVLYNERHRMINRYRLEEYTVCADLKADASELMLVSVSAVQGRMVTRIALTTPGESEWGESFDVWDAYPVACRYTEDGNICLLSTDALCFFNPQGQEISRHNLTASQVVSFQLTEAGCVLTCRDDVSDRSTRVLAFDKWGNLEYNVSVEGVARDVCYVFGSLAILLQDQLIFYRDVTESTPVELPLKGSYHHVLAYENLEFILCGDAKAITVKP